MPCDHPQGGRSEASSATCHLAGHSLTSVAHSEDKILMGPPSFCRVLTVVQRMTLASADDWRQVT